MDPLIRDLASNLLPMVLGAVGTGIGWAAKALIKARKDLNTFYRLSREQQKHCQDLEHRVECLEQALYYGEE